jgi:hypothetical protein
VCPLCKRTPSPCPFWTATPSSRAAERLLKREHVEDALVVARMALALAGPSSELALAGRAEDITEDCLHLLDREGR